MSIYIHHINYTKANASFKADILIQTKQYNIIASRF